MDRVATVPGTRPLAPPLVMIGAIGAVGGEVVAHRLEHAPGARSTLLGRRERVEWRRDGVEQHLVDLERPGTWETLIAGHEVAVCTLGVGQPSAVSREVFVRIDKTLVLDFASACRDAGMRHFQLLGQAEPATTGRWAADFGR